MMARSLPRLILALGKRCLIAGTTALALAAGVAFAAPIEAASSLDKSTPGAASAPATTDARATAVAAARTPADSATGAKATRRPRIGVVLSGGGARGMTHIGVLKVLDELRIPVDYVAATSMGSIVGGLYASGMSPAEMQQVVTTMNWRSMFSDSPPRREMDFRDKQREARYPLPLEIGFRDGEFRGFKGALSGSNLELFLHNLTSDADGIRMLDNLPIPFRAVSTDMVTGHPYVFTEGPLYEAMRASMSIPGVFSPIESRGHLLGDGGLVDNLPIDVVREMGAEIVIAVNIGTPLMSRDQLSSIIGLTGQMINILTEQNVRAQIASLRSHDILISPDLGDLSAIDFDKSAQFIAKGEAIARETQSRLTKLALPEPEYRAYLAARPRLVDTPPPVVDFVRVTGTEYANPKALEAMLDIPLGKKLDTEHLDAGIARLDGTSEYERIDYRMVQEGDEHGVIVDVQEKAMGPNYLRFGLIYATDFQGESTAALLLGHRRVWINSLGAEWRNELSLGRQASIATEFYQPLDITRSAFVSAYASARNVPRYIFSGEVRVAEYSMQVNGIGADFGIPLGNQGEIRIGPVYTYYRGNPVIASTTYEVARETDAGGRILGRWDTLDNPFFPQRGARGTLDVFYGRRTQNIGDSPDVTLNDLARLDAAGLAAFRLTADDSLNIGLRAGALNRDAPSVVDPFLLGGLFNLSGLREGQLSGSYLGLARAVYYHRLTTIPLIGGAIYAGGSLEAGNTWKQRDMVSAKDLTKAGSIFVAADTFIGPIYFAYGRASGNQSSFYLFVGRPP